MSLRVFEVVSAVTRKKKKSSRVVEPQRVKMKNEGHMDMAVNAMPHISNISALVPPSHYTFHCLQIGLFFKVSEHIYHKR